MDWGSQKWSGEARSGGRESEMDWGSQKRSRGVKVDWGSQEWLACNWYPP